MFCVIGADVNVQGCDHKTVLEVAKENPEIHEHLRKVTGKRTWCDDI